MEILRPGRDQAGWSKEFECTGVGRNAPGCGALLKATKADLFRTHVHDMSGERDETILPCPLCGAKTVLAEPFEELVDADEWYAAHPEALALVQKRQEWFTINTRKRGW